MTFTTDVKNVHSLQRHKHGGAYATASLRQCVVDDTLVYAFPLLRNALLQLLHSPHLLPVDSPMELVSLQTADICYECRTTFVFNAEFYCHIKINLESQIFIPYSQQATPLMYFWKFS